MGNGYTHYCPKCNFKIFLMHGIGLSYREVSKKLRKRYMESDEIPELKRFIERYPEGYISGSVTTFQCPKCLKFSTMEDLSFYIEGPQKKENFDFWNKSPDRELWRFKPRCRDCNVEMSRLLVRPKCLEKLKIDFEGAHGSIMWWD